MPVTLKKRVKPGNNQYSTFTAEVKVSVPQPYPRAPSPNVPQNPVVPLEASQLQMDILFDIIGRTLPPYPPVVDKAKFNIALRLTHHPNWQGWYETFGDITANDEIKQLIYEALVTRDDARQEYSYLVEVSR